MRVWILGHFCLFFFFFYAAFLSWLGQNPPLSNEIHWFPLNFFSNSTNHPDFDFLKQFQLKKWYKNYDGFPTTNNFNFLGCGDVQFPQLHLQIRVHLQFQQRLKGARLEFVRFLAIGLHNLGARAEHSSSLQSAGLQRAKSDIRSVFIEHSGVLMNQVFRKGSS